MPLTIDTAGRSLRDYIGHIRSRNTREAIETASALESLQDTLDTLTAAIDGVVDYLNSASSSGGSTVSGVTSGEADYTLTVASTPIPAPAANYQFYFVVIRQDATGGRGIVWDPIFRADQLAYYPVNPDSNKISTYFFTKHENEYWLIFANVGI